MIRRFVCAAVVLLASWSVTNTSYAGFSINLPGFGLNLPLPGAQISIGLPVVAAPVYPSYYRAELNGPPPYVRYNGGGRFYGDRYYYDHGDRADFNRPHRRYMERGSDHYRGRFDGGNFRGYDHGR